MKNAGTLSLTHERVDDIPLLLGFMQQLNFPILLEQHLGSHHLHRGLSNGWLATVWLAFVLSQSNHRKVSVEDWAGNHCDTLETLIGERLRPAEFGDDRLSIILRRLRDADWTALEADLWAATCEVYEISYQCIRLDSTTSFGYHTITPDGLMQRGHSKDHRPDLPQLKLMAAAAQPTSHILACDIVPGHSADDPLYLPLIRRVRQQLRQHGLLYTGDCKMSALATRAELAAEKDHYLMPLPRTGDNAEQIDAWIDEAARGTQPLQKLTRLNEEGKKVTFAWAYERERPQSSKVADQEVAWTERVQVVRSLDLAKRQAKQLEERLCEAAAALRALTPPVGRGHKQYRDEEPLRAAVAAIVQQYRVDGLLTVTWEREEQRRTRYQGSGRGGPGRPTYTTTKVRYVIKTVRRNETAIEEAKARQGWRVQVTNLPSARWSLREAVLLYNGGWSVERDFHLLKDQPLGIQPLFVREEEQIIGLTRLLTIALRVLTLIELQVRSGLAEAEEALTGLYEGQPTRATAYPTAGRCLKAISRMEITATRVESGQDVRWHVTALPSLLTRIMKLLHLSPTLYTCLTKTAA
ncbi:MAG: IS1634 family transposase [Planctomycetes bacterium]|nr:IS1634 family transposase [Planctomycetota bacterium]